MERGRSGREEKEGEKEDENTEELVEVEAKYGEEVLEKWKKQ